MKRNEPSMYSDGDFFALREEINAENRKAIRYFALAGIPLGIINYIAQMVILGVWALLPQGLLLVLCALLVLAADRGDCSMPGAKSHARSSFPDSPPASSTPSCSAPSGTPVIRPRRSCCVL